MSIPWKALSKPFGPKDKILRKEVETCKQRREIKYSLLPHSMHCTNSAGCINGRITPEQYPHSLQHILPSLTKP